MPPWRAGGPWLLFTDGDVVFEPEALKRSVAFYRTIGKLSEPFTLWLSGGAARLPGLPQRLEELLEAPVQVFDPLKSVNGDRPAGAEKSPQFAQALGLALRTA